jgi:hypothetical protein
MKTLTWLLFLFFIISAEGSLSACSGINEFPAAGISWFPDSLRDRQQVYNGVLWSNTHRRINGDPFLFTNIFLPGEVSIDGRKFTDIKIRYDIYSDEIMAPRDLDQIICLNKEMIDSFSIVFEGKVNRFIKVDGDTVTGFNGYLQRLYEGESALYVKYEKRIFTEVTSLSDGEFYQVQTVFLVTEGKYHEIRKLKDILRIAGDDKKLIRDYLRENRISAGRKVPESFVPVVRYFDTLKE